MFQITITKDLWKMGIHQLMEMKDLVIDWKTWKADLKKSRRHKTQATRKFMII